MHIGLVIYGSLDIISGGYLYDRKLVEFLRENGDEVTIISLPWRNYISHCLDNFSVDLKKRLLNIPVDILVQDELNHPSLFWLIPEIKSKVNYPMISLVHHLRSSEKFPIWEKLLYAKVEEKYLNAMDGFILNSQTTSETVQNLGVDVSQRPSIVAYPGGGRLAASTSMKEIEKRAYGKDPLKIIFVGNLISRKGLHSLVGALSKVPKDKWKLTVIGRTDVDLKYTKKIYEMIQRFNLMDRIDLLGSQDDEALKTLLQNSHILAVPSSYEGFGIVYMEAMSFGLPVIAGSLGAVGEIVTDGIEGFLVEHNEENSLVNRINCFIDDRSLVVKMGERALQRYQRHPSWEQSMHNIREFLRKMV